MTSLPVMLALLGAVAYASTFWYLLMHLMQKTPPGKMLTMVLLCLGLFLHGLVLFPDLITPAGINYNIFNLFSLTCWLMLAFSLLFSSYRPILGLNLLATPVACIGLLMSVIWKAPLVVLNQGGIGLDVHIFLSLSAYCILFMASIQAVLLWVQNRELKQKSNKRIWVALLPPLQTMEKLLFDMILLGFVILTAALAFGFFTVDSFLAQHLAHKTVFSILSWLVFGVLLIGHWRLGWRGQRAVSFTLWGFGLLLTGFIGSKLVLELILKIPA
ncbi:inner membrane protein YpjD [Alkanindiges sp. WGS2144]|uniref:cytochrome C assembly family protein n=1 Tax=Alkanindiges sp. WGS2144 TaxID=3366808 RepID=UPI003752CFC1